MYEKIEKTRLFIENMIGIKPEIGIVLGTGLGNFTNKMEIIKSIPYNTIPNFPLSTVLGQIGRAHV